MPWALRRLGREVLMRSLERLAREQRSDPTLTMHVNVTVQELMHGDLPEHVFAALRATGVRPDTVTLEITENAIIDTSTGAGAEPTGGQGWSAWSISDVVP